MTEAGALRLLLADDDVGERDAVRRALAAAGIEAELEEAESVAAAVARLRAGRFDCALLDHDLPGGDGVQILRHVREAGVSTPIIILTGEGDDQAAVRLMKAGAADCLSRSALSAERLGQSLRHALRVHTAEQEAEAAAATLSRYLRQLRMLADAAIAINSAQQQGPLLSAVAKQARIVIGAHQAMVTLSVDDDPENANTCVSLSEKYAEHRSLLTRIDPLGIGDMVCDTGRPVRLTAAELEAHPRQAALARRGTEDDDAIGELPARGWLAAPLVARSGTNIGVIHLSDRTEGEFTAEDEAILVQLAQLAAVAIENLRLYEAARQAARAREQVLAMVSHDLRNPLNTVVMGTALLLDTELPEETVRKQLTAIQRSADTMNRMIQDLLDVTRMEAGKLSIATTRLSAHELAQQACEMMEAMARERSLAIECTAPRRLPDIAGDRDRLLQVFSNLIGNAIKFTEPGGRVAVEARTFGTEVRFSVSDTGPGIATEHLHRIFEPFWQVQHTSRLGAGLGLPIAKGIIEAHGGRIWAESVPGRGSTFCFTIPAAEGDGAEGDAAARASS